MQDSKVITIKECKKCGAVFYADDDDVTLEYGVRLEIINVLITSCMHCPKYLSPR
jgi:hypothetical protein